MFNIKKLKKLGYGDSISFKVHIVKNNLSYLQDRIRFSLDEMEDYTRFIVKFFIDIYVSDLENDTDTKAGFMEGYFILPEEFMDYSDFFDVCDAHSQELSDMASSLIEKNRKLKEEYANDEDCICYVSDFYIYKKFRNCGIGSYVISELQDILFYYASEVITKTILLPKSRVLTNQRRLQNISDKNQNKELLHSNLIKFYKQNGFEFIKGKDYMWRDEKF